MLRRLIRPGLWAGGTIFAAALVVGLINRDLFAVPIVPWLILVAGVVVFFAKLAPRSKVFATLFKWVLAPLFGGIPAVLIGDSKGRVGGDSKEKGYSVTSQWFGAVAWVSTLPFLILWVGLTIWGEALWLLLLILPTGVFLFGRRFAASAGTEMTVREWWRRVRQLAPFNPREKPVFDVETGKQLNPSNEPTNWWQVRLVLSAVVMGVAALLGPVIGSDFAAGLLLDWAGPAAAVGAWWPAFFAAGYWLLLPLSVKAAILHHENEEESNATDSVWRHQLAKVFGVSENEWDGSRAKLEFGPDNRTITVSPFPFAARENLHKLESRTATFMGDWTVTHSDAETVEFSLVEDHSEVKAKRAALKVTDGAVFAFEKLPATPTRPESVLWHLNPDVRVTAAQLEALAAKLGARLIEFDAAAHFAVVGQLPPTVVGVRDRLSELLGKNPWDVELAVKTMDGRIDRVTIFRLPALGVDPEKRLGIWKKLVLAIPGGSNGWAIDDDPVSGQVALTYGQPRALPPVVPAANIFDLPVEKWNRIPIGRDEHGEMVGIDLKAGPHSLIVGGTGSGKSTALRVMILGALARGFELVFVDPVKRGAGLKAFIPHSAEFMTTADFGRAADVAEAVYAEVRRRVDLIDEADGESWEDLPAGTVKPILFVLDEYNSLVAAGKKPLVRGPDMDEWEEESTAKSRIFVAVEKMAREARSAGVFLVLSLQRGDASVIGGAVRDNLGTKLHLVPSASKPSGESLKMIFDGEVAEASEVIAELHDGRPGFAVSVSDGSVMRGYRVCHVEKDDLPEWLDQFQVPAGTPLVLPQKRGEFDVTRRSEAPAAPVEEVVGEFTFSLDDLEGDSGDSSVTPWGDGDDVVQSATPEVRDTHSFSFDD